MRGILHIGAVCRQHHHTRPKYSPKQANYPSSPLPWIRTPVQRLRSAREIQAFPSTRPINSPGSASETSYVSNDKGLDSHRQTRTESVSHCITIPPPREGSCPGDCIAPACLLSLSGTKASGQTSEKLAWSPQAISPGPGEAGRDSDFMVSRRYR